MIFYLLLTHTSCKRERKQNFQNCIYKLSDDDKILSSLVKKAWCTCTFLNDFREANEQLLCALFQ